MIVRLDRCAAGEYLTPAIAAGLPYLLSSVEESLRTTDDRRLENVRLDYQMLTGSPEAASAALELAMRILEDKLLPDRNISAIDAVGPLNETFDSDTADQILIGYSALVHLSDPQSSLARRVLCGFNQLLQDPTFGEVSADVILSDESSRLLPRLLAQLLGQYLVDHYGNVSIKTIQEVECTVGVIHKTKTVQNQTHHYFMSHKGGIRYV